MKWVAVAIMSPFLVCGLAYQTIISGFAMGRVIAEHTLDRIMNGD